MGWGEWREGNLNPKAFSWLEDYIVGNHLESLFSVEVS